tara:strand:- start:365 stop:610 length:246 start_codon:yes stop_codon:yes gene_type:complete
MKCIKEVRKKNSPCDKETCRKWINYNKDLNCVLETVRKNKNSKLTLREVADRLGVSFVRVKQIEEKAIQKLKAIDLTQYKD